MPFETPDNEPDKRRRWRRPVWITFMVLGVFALVSNSLSGCSRGSSVARVFGSFDISFRNAQVNSPEFKRFKIVYNKYAAAAGNRDQQLKHFSDALYRIRTEYVYPTDDHALVNSAISGIEKMTGKPGTLDPQAVTEAALDSILLSLDPHSSYLNPDEFHESRIVTTGQFGGLGIEINMEDGLIRIISPIADTPAFRVGLKPGDLIVAADDIQIKGKSLMEAVKLLRGAPNTDVRLRIRRAGVQDFDVTITRAIIQIQPVKVRIEGNIGVVRITHFIQNTEDALEDAMEAITSKLGHNLAGLVLDLRNNPGGLLHQSVAVADAFLPRGDIVSVREREGEVRKFTSVSGDLSGGVPMVVLINRGSASASEIVAGALQDHRRATVLGSQSFGKGSVQTITPLDWDGALRLTTALYYLPSGRTIQGNGVSPDIRITSDVAPSGRREVDLPNALPSAKAANDNQQRPQISDGKCPLAGRDGKDKILGCALMFLRAGSQDRFLALVGARKNL